MKVKPAISKGIGSPSAGGMNCTQRVWGVYTTFFKWVEMKQKPETFSWNLPVESESPLTSFDIIFSLHLLVNSSQFYWWNLHFSPIKLCVVLVKSWCLMYCAVDLGVSWKWEIPKSSEVFEYTVMAQRFGLASGVSPWLRKPPKEPLEIHLKRLPISHLIAPVAW